MRVFLSALYCLFMTPVQVRLYLAMTDKSPLCGYALLVIGGVPIRLPLLFIRPEDENSFCLFIGSRRIRLQRKRRRKPFRARKAAFQRFIRLWRRDVDLDLRILLGFQDAAATALACAALRETLRALPISGSVQPFYAHPSFTAQARCIACFRLGKLFLTAAALGLSSLRQGIAGRARHGNQPGQANRLRHADGA